MNADESLWERVEAALDARRNPLDDASLARELRAEPDTLAATKRLVARLAQLRGDPAAGRSSPARERRAANTRRLIAYAAGTLALVGVALLALRAPRPVLTVGSAGQATREAPDTSRVSLVIETLRPERSRRDPAALETRQLLSWNLEER